MPDELPQELINYCYNEEQQSDEDEEEADGEDEQMYGEDEQMGYINEGEINNEPQPFALLDETLSLKRLQLLDGS